ncbi:AAA family ATPase [Actinacidiphila alni]|uniref:helix-turn-helix transcriptional regulator n=1 Tax=Actinacidiphila alni TaxID=380248 RepID=UPI0033FBF05A
MALPSGGGGGGWDSGGSERGGRGEGGGTEPPLGAPAFVGRERELAVALEALARPPALVMIEGEAGIGKTRLLGELLSASGRQPSALVATCPPFLQPHTLGPVTDAIRQAAPSGVGRLRLSGLAGALRPLLPEWSDQLPPAPEAAQDVTAARHRLFRALRELLEALGVEVFVLEDAQWVDDATAEFLIFLGAQRPPRTSVVITYRPEGIADGSPLPRLRAALGTGLARARIPLGPLTAPQTHALVASMLHGGPVSAGFTGLLHEGTDGVPLAVEESVRLLHDRADLVDRGDGWSRRRTGAAVIPPTVRDAVLERVGGLGPRTRAVLRAGAVLGDASDPGALLAVSGLARDDAVAGLEGALASALMAEDDRGLIAFRHALAGRAVYDAAPAGERRAMHLRAGRSLERTTPKPVARLARHFRAAGQLPEWAGYAERAADQALAGGDDALAAATLHDLVTSMDRSPGEMLRLVRKCVSTAPLGHDQLHGLVAALRTVLDGGHASPAEAARLQVQLGRMLFNLRQYEDGRGLLEQALAHAELGATDRARAMNLLGWPDGSDQPAHVHRRWLRRAGDVVAQVVGPERGSLELERTTGLLVFGEQEGWAAAAALDGMTASMLPSVRILLDLNISDLATTWGRFAESGRRLERVLRMPEIHHYPRLHGTALVNRARLDWFRGAWDDLLVRAGRLAADEHLLPPIRNEARLVAALVGGATGTPTAATGQAIEALSALIAGEQLGPRFVMESAGALARLLLRDGDVAGALAVTEEPAATVAGRGVWIWGTDVLPARVAALVAAGRAEQAAGLTAGLARGLRGRDAPGPRAALLLCRAVLAADKGGPVRAAAGFAAAAAAWDALPRPYDALLAREHQAGHLLAAGEHTAARTVLARVADGLSELGAHRDAQRVSELLRGPYGEPRRRRGRPSYGRQLSPRERQVVTSVAAGRTNGQIAEALRLSPHTVRMHVKSAMRKLDVPTRRELTLRAAESDPETPGEHRLGA